MTSINGIKVLTDKQFQREAEYFGHERRASEGARFISYVFNGILRALDGDVRLINDVARNAANARRYPEFVRMTAFMRPVFSHKTTDGKVIRFTGGTIKGKTARAKWLRELDDSGTPNWVAVFNAQTPALTGERVGKGTKPKWDANTTAQRVLASFVKHGLSADDLIAAIRKADKAAKEAAAKKAA